MYKKQANLWESPCFLYHCDLKSNNFRGNSQWETGGKFVGIPMSSLVDVHLIGRIAQCTQYLSLDRWWLTSFTLTGLKMMQDTIDDLHISHNASGMEANIRVLLIRNSSSHSSLDVNGLELPCITATLCFTRLRNQGSSLMHSRC